MYFDAHTHTQFAAFEDDYKEVIERAHNAGVQIVNVGTQLNTSARAIKIAHEYKEGVYATVGLHPTHTKSSYHDNDEIGPAPAEASVGKDGEATKTFSSHGEQFDSNAYKELASDKLVVAIGECGLDYYRLSEETRTAQQNIFKEHIRLAKDVGKPLMIHCRNAFSDLIAILRSEDLPINPGIIHFFTGTPIDAKKLLKLGFSFTFGGVVTFTRDYDESINLIPPDRILSETDAPYVSPVPYRGKRNEPVHVIHIVKKLAEIRGVSAEEMESQIFANAKRVFML